MRRSGPPCGIRPGERVRAPPPTRDMPSGNSGETRRTRVTRTMIITRSPLRISLGGGGTDLPSYYRQHGGFVIGGAIDKYVYITLHQTFDQELIIKYSRMERV